MYIWSQILHWGFPKISHNVAAKPAILYIVVKALFQVLVLLFRQLDLFQQDLQYMLYQDSI